MCAHQHNQAEQSMVEQSLDSSTTFIHYHLFNLPTLRTNSLSLFQSSCKATYILHTYRIPTACMHAWWSMQHSVVKHLVAWFFSLHHVKRGSCYLPGCMPNELPCLARVPQYRLAISSHLFFDFKITLFYFTFSLFQVVNLCFIFF